MRTAAARQLGDGPERYTMRRVEFARSFTLGGAPEVYDAGTYEVETREEAREAAGHTFYVRLSTVLMIPTATGVRHHTVSGSELDAALLRDAEGGIGGEPSENPDRGHSDEGETAALPPVAR